MKKIFVAGHNGMVGSAICRYLVSSSEPIQIISANRDELNLLNQCEVLSFFENSSIDEIYLCAAKVGGIYANNTFPADFIYENLMIQANIIHSAHLTGVDKLLFLGSSCIYPKFSDQPIKEEYLMTGSLEPSNEPYAIAKIAGIKLCESYNRQFERDYRSIMPTNLYGPGDNFHEKNSHVIPALIRRFHQAKIDNKDDVTIWGTGKPKREFLHVNDMARASVFVMNLPKEAYLQNTSPMLSHINVGTGVDISIRELAQTIAHVVDYRGKINFDDSKLDGTPRKLLDISKLNNLGWQSSIELEEGLLSTYKWFIENSNNYRL